MTTAELQATAAARQCENAVQAAMGSVERIAPGRWLAQHKDASGPPLAVWLADGFVILAQELGPRAPSLRWELVRAGAAPGGLVKFCTAEEGCLSLRADIPTGAAVDLPMRVARAWASFASASQLTLDLAEPPAGLAENPPPNLPVLVEAAGWQCSSQRDDRCAVPLATRQGGQTALVTVQDSGVRISAELASWDSLPTPCREALAILLLAANARLRLARAVVTEDDNGGAAQLEVVFQLPVCAAELRSAFEALSVGADVCAPAADSLRHEAAAQVFLALRDGPCSRENSEQNTNERTHDTSIIRK